MHEADTQLLALWRRHWLLSARQAEQTIDRYTTELSSFAQRLPGRLIGATRLDMEDFVSERLGTSCHSGR